MLTMSLSKSQKKNKEWTFEVVNEIMDLYKICYDRSYVLGSLFARTESKALRKFKNSKAFPWYIRNAASEELALRNAEKKASRLYITLSE